MDKVSLILLSVIALTAFTMCTNDESSKEIPKLQAFTRTGCKSYTPQNVDMRRSLGAETIYYEATSDNCLMINHVNALLPCEAEISTDVVVEGNVITISENGKDSGLNCVCSYDLTMKIGPLKVGNYKVVICRDDFQFQYLTFDINYSPSLQGEIRLKVEEEIN